MQKHREINLVNVLNVIYPIFSPLLLYRKKFFAEQKFSRKRVLNNLTKKEKEKDDDEYK
jgi:hypothetical protein